MTNANPVYLSSRAPSTPADRKLRDELQERFVRELWYLIAAVSVLLVIIRLTRFLLSRISSKTPATSQTSEKGDIERLSSPSSGKRALRNTFSAFATTFKIIAFRLTLPIGSQSRTTIAEVTFIAGYIIAVLTWLFVETRHLQPVFWQDRAGHLAACQVPLIVALAGKNNIISFFTGIGHEKLNVLHRASARTCLLLAWIHALGRINSGLPPQFDFTHDWVRAGAVAISAFTLATFLSFRPIRHIAFEFFLISHIVLIAIFIICGFFHAGKQGFGAYFWPALVIWAADRCARVVHVLWNSRTSQEQSSKATVELLAEDTVRVTLRRRMDWTPGQHAYLIVPSVSAIPFEAHPFTMASVPKRVAATEDNEIVFLIRGRGGFTQRLKEYARSHASNSLPVYLDGPYGNPPNLHKYSTCILIAGGSGISYTLAQLHDLVHNHKGDKSSVRRVVFLWAVRDGGHLSWVTKVLSDALAAAPPALSIEPRVYVTGPNYSTPSIPKLDSDIEGSVSSLDSPDKEINELPIYTALKLTHGRPSIKKLLHEEILSTVGPVSVDVAGPSALTEAIRQALCKYPASADAALKGVPSVTLHVETFGMVTG
ncbi:hypothetical protein HGRIS_009726 [Hohenbuehelia grisea]|uniref:ferric-chelate reductase (NADPH) n=1 Tax=Hohenbuehelia grisea TaxID=104357 RepID=A0ABR3J256_9AGAR